MHSWQQRGSSSSPYFPEISVSESEMLSLWLTWTDEIVGQRDLRLRQSGPLNYTPACPPAAVAARGIATDLVVKMTQFNRTTQFFVDWSASTRLARLRNEGMIAASAYPITRSERQRLSRAIIRYQILLNIQSVPVKPEENQLVLNKPVHPKFLALFETWELQQIWEFAGFVAFLSSEGRGVSIVSVNIVGIIIVSVDIVDLRRKLQLEFKRAPWRERGLRAAFSHQDLEYKSCVPAGEWFMGGYSFPRRLLSDVDDLPMSLLPGDDAWRRAVAEMKELYVLEEELPALKAGDDSDGDIPYAWVNAMAGLDCRRWGKLLMREPANTDTTTMEDRANAFEKLKRWRMLGFMFWDERRVEMMKAETKEITGFKTGWLLNVWDDVVSMWDRGEEDPLEYMNMFQ